MVATYREQIYAEESIHLEVKTRDGDIVTLPLESMQGYQGLSEYGAFYERGEAE